jgi:hypothetical protein
MLNANMPLMKRCEGPLLGIDSIKPPNRALVCRGYARISIELLASSAI